MEKYLFFDMVSDPRVFHFYWGNWMQQNILSCRLNRLLFHQAGPSIAVWQQVIMAMCGENIMYDDMVFVSMDRLK